MIDFHHIDLQTIVICLKTQRLRDFHHFRPQR